MIEYQEMTEGQRMSVRAMFHPTRGGYGSYMYEITDGGWVISRRRKADQLLATVKIMQALGIEPGDLERGD